LGGINITKIVAVVKKTYPEIEGLSFSDSTVAMSYTVRDGADPNELLQKLINGMKLANELELATGDISSA